MAPCHTLTDDGRAVTLSSVASVAVGAIGNDDLATISIDDLQLNEGQDGTTDFTFTISTDSIASEVITLSADTSALTAEGSGIDFVDVSNQLLTILTGAISTTVTVSVIGDGLAEPNENFELFESLGDIGKL